MNMKQRLFTISVLLCTFLMAAAQTGADYLKASPRRADVTITFNVADEGKEYRVNWGMDAAW